MSALVWHDGWGYRCPRCKLFVALPQRDVPQYCPRCPASEPAPVTAVDRPDNGQDEGDAREAAAQEAKDWLAAWRKGYAAGLADAPERDRPASARAGAGEQQRELAARWLFDQRMPARYWDNPSFELERDAARQMADELLHLLDRTQPDGDVRQHHMDADCWCQPIDRGHGIWDHRNAEVEG